MAQTMSQGRLVIFPAAGETSASAQLLRQRGVYETPVVLVGYVIRSVHRLLQDRFGKPAGLADRGVRVLDPAAGPANFLTAGLQWIRDQVGPEEFKALRWDHLLPHFAGYEVLPAFHRQGLEEMALFFGGLRRMLRRGDEPRLFLRDALGPSTAGALQGGEIAVVLGNPPWCGCSLNRGPWIEELLEGYALPDGRSDEGYFRVDGEPLGERNTKWVRDDYVKFLRLAQWLIDQKGQGIAALVVNHNCLEAPTFRGLRHSLLGTFDEIYALDLHGNRRRRERDPQGGPDENVFRGVSQGAAVLFLVKRPGLRQRVLRADFYGSRREKAFKLAGETVETTSWQPAEPRSPLFLFSREDRENEESFAKGLSLPEIFPVHGTGVITGRDALWTGLDRKSLEKRLARAAQWEPSWPRRITTFLVRPFDLRHLLYDVTRLERARPAMMAHLSMGSSLGLVVPRQCKEEPGALVTCWIAGHKAVSAHDVSSLFPLYLNDQDRGATPNLRPVLRERLSDLYGEALTPEAVFAYVYAVLYSPPYRLRYREQLRRSFPRIRFPRQGQLFHPLSDLGRELIELHLLRDPRLARGCVTFAGDSGQDSGKNPEALRFDRSNGRLYLNGGASWLEGVGQEVWEYRIGGYPVLRQWLRARADRVPGYGEARELRSIAEALRLTLRIQRQMAATFLRIEASGDLGSVL